MANTPNHTRGELHPRNVHRAPYDFARLTAVCPELRPFVRPHPAAGETIDFADPDAVLVLNRALLKLHYGVAHWEIPPGYLCPPVPSRADYLHTVADLPVESGVPVRVLDIGVGANCVYPLIGAHAYGWRFVGTDVDTVAVASARKIVADNPGLAGKIEIRLQPDPAAIFRNVARPGEAFALSICNPPFHASPEAAEAGTLRKLRNLGSGRNFGGRSHELWCEGGEIGFIRRMIAESAERPDLCTWFTTLVSQRGSLPAIERALARARAAGVRTMTLFAGQKQSRIVAWTFGQNGLPTDCAD